MNIVRLILNVLIVFVILCYFCKSPMNFSSTHKAIEIVANKLNTEAMLILHEAKNTNDYSKIVESISLLKAASYLCATNGIRTPHEILENLLIATQLRNQIVFS